MKIKQQETITISHPLDNPEVFTKSVQSPGGRLKGAIVIPPPFWCEKSHRWMEWIPWDEI